MRRAVHTLASGRCGLSLLWLWLGATVLLLGPGAAAVGAAGPLLTEDTRTLDPGQIELELRGDYAKAEEGTLWRFATGVNIGVLPGLEVDAEAAFVHLNPDEGNTRSGLGTTFVTVKYRFLDETERRPAFMGAVVLGLPTGNEDFVLVEEGVLVQPIAVISKTFGPLMLTLNGGYIFNTADSDRDFWVVRGSFEYKVTDAWTIVGEVSSELSARGDTDIVVLRPGTVLAITEGIEVYTAVGFGLTRDSPDVTVTLGVKIALF
ncbi:MAG TPA: transporter [Candidatus Methylomirabilis sp.]|nr:transporter [Candidatus Methylomirabilis sp.]